MDFTENQTFYNTIRIVRTQNSFSWTFHNIRTQYTRNKRYTAKRILNYYSFFESLLSLDLTYKLIFFRFS